MIDKGSFDRLLADRLHLPDLAPTLQHLTELRALTPFLHLDPSGLEQIREHGTWNTYTPGSAVVTQGEAGDAFYVIESGQLDVTEDTTFRRILGPGDNFGEIALLVGVPRTATVRAITPARLFRIERVGFDALLAGAFRAGRLRSAVPVEFIRE